MICPAICKNNKNCKNKGKPEFGGFCGVHKNKYIIPVTNCELFENMDLIRSIADKLPIKGILSFTSTCKKYYNIRNDEKYNVSISNKIKNHELYDELLGEVLVLKSRRSPACFRQIIGWKVTPGGSPRIYAIRVGNIVDEERHNNPAVTYTTKLDIDSLVEVTKIVRSSMMCKRLYHKYMETMIIEDSYDELYFKDLSKNKRGHGIMENIWHKVEKEKYEHTYTAFDDFLG